MTVRSFSTDDGSKLPYPFEPYIDPAGNPPIKTAKQKMEDRARTQPPQIGDEIDWSRGLAVNPFVMRGEIPISQASQGWDSERYFDKPNHERYERMMLAFVWSALFGLWIVLVSRDARVLPKTTWRQRERLIQSQSKRVEGKYTSVPGRDVDEVAVDREYYVRSIVPNEIRHPDAPLWRIANGDLPSYRERFCSSVKDELCEPYVTALAGTKCEVEGWQTLLVSRKRVPRPHEIEYMKARLALCLGQPSKLATDAAPTQFGPGMAPHRARHLISQST